MYFSKSNSRKGMTQSGSALGKSKEYVKFCFLFVALKLSLLLLLGAQKEKDPHHYLKLTVISILPPAGVLS